jgi:hypothetical protein
MNCENIVAIIGALQGTIALFIAYKSNKIAEKPTIFDDNKNEYLKQMAKVVKSISLLSDRIYALNLKLDKIAMNIDEKQD